MKASESPNIPFIESAVVRLFIPPALRESRALEAYDTRVVILIASALIALGPVYAAMCVWVYDTPQMAVGIAATTVVCCFGLILVRLTGDTLWMSQLICAALLVGVTWLVWQSRGIESPVMAWLLTVPIMATVMRREKFSRNLWTLLVILVVAGIYMAPHLGLEPNSLEAGQETAQLFLATSLIGLLLLVLAVFSLRHGVERWFLEVAKREAEEQWRVEEESRRAHERAWKKSRESLHALMENSPEAIVVHDTEKVFYGNPAFAEMIGSDENPEGRRLIEFARETDAEEFERSLETLWDRDSLRIRNANLVRDDGLELPVEVTAFRASFEQQPVFISIILDLSERRQLRAKMMQMDRMIAVGTLAAGVAHEINNPLAFVHSNVEFLLRRFSSDSSGPVRELSKEEILGTLKDTLSGTRRIRDIVSDLRTFSGRRDQEMIPMEVEQTLESAINMAGNRIRERAQLVRDYSGLPTIECDESGLAQVFMNLLVNAAQAIEPGAPEDNVIRISTQMEGDEAVIEIADTGRGISEADLDRIFDPFYSTKAQEQGMGLGLSICRNIMHRIEGKLQVESCPGEGTTFRVFVPARLTAEDSAELEISAGPTGDAQGRVILIDDEPMLLRSQKRQLESDFEVETYRSAAAALEAIGQGEEPLLILCDLQMPEISGVDFFHRLREEYPELIEGLVFMTGGAFTEEVRDFLDGGKYRVLEKPYTLQQLTELLEERYEVMAS